MNNATITIITLTASGSLLALLLFICKPLLKNKVSKTFCYYIWLVVLVRLVIPLNSPVNLMDAVFKSPEMRTIITMDENNGEDNTQTITPPNSQITENENMAISPQNEAIPSSTKEAHTFDLWSFVRGKLLWIWLVGTLISYGRYITAYSVFSRRIRHSCVIPHHEDLAVFVKKCGNNKINLACSSYVTTPMLIGFFKPIIILPQNAYVLNGMSDELEFILLHELIHLRRKDVLYKWLVVTITSMHWFNPLMIFIRREIGKACELSCDEAVIRNISAFEKQKYGNTLLALAANKKFPVGILATTLCEEKNVLKERLLNIMAYKKKSKWTVALILVLSLFLTGCATILGTARISDNVTSNATESTQDKTEYMRNTLEAAQNTDNASLGKGDEGIKTNPISNKVFLSNLTLDNQSKKDDSLEVITQSNDNSMPGKVILNVVLGNGKTIEKIYEGNWFATTYTEDLLSDGTEEILLFLQNTTSNYSSSEVHVLKVQNGNLDEILTIMDAPEDLTTAQKDKYKTSLFLIPWPKDNFSLPDTYAQDYVSVCSGGMPVDIIINGTTKRGIKISHYDGMPQSNTYYSIYGKEFYPYSIIIWDGNEWIVAQQGIDDAPQTKP